MTFQITGTVKRRFTTKNGNAFTLEYQNPRSQYPDEVSVWADLDVIEGDVVTVAGDYSDRIEDYTNRAGEQKRTIRRNLNNVRLVESPASGAVRPQDATGGPSADPWRVEPDPTVYTGTYGSPQPFDSDSVPF